MALIQIVVNETVIETTQGAVIEVVINEPLIEILDCGAVIQQVGGVSVIEIVNETVITVVEVVKEIIEVVTSGTTIIGGETGFPWYFIPSLQTVLVPVNRQHLQAGGMTIEGEFIVNGEAIFI